MRTFVALREPADWGFAADYAHPSAYVEVKWAAYLPSQRDIVAFHREVGVPMIPEVQVLENRIDENGDRQINCVTGCAFDRPDVAMLFKLTFAGG